MGFDSQKLLRSMRLSLAYLIIFWITTYLVIPEPGWCYVTALSVLFEYSTVGGVLTKSFLRITATLSAVIYSIVVVYFFANIAILNLIALIGGIFIYAYFFMGSKFQYGGFLGNLTLVMMLINYNNLDVVVLRPFNIIIGLIIALSLMRYFYPQYARDLVIKTQADMLLQLINILNDFLNKSQSVQTIKDNFLVHENKFLADLTNFNRFNEEARFETRKAPSFTSKNISALGYTKRIYHLVSVLVFHLANEELRSYVIIDDNITQVRNYLSVLRVRLLNVELPVSPQLAPLVLNKIQKDSLKEDDPEVFLDIMFVELAKELGELKQIIDDVLLIRSNKYCLT
ncbi:inner membrane protein [Legionella sainthelensi]|uniref:Inner membrane protein n=1 Tax=Legionella sainthelensi TaxID=28087 RepID=A0A0W0YUL2_9GAMM|nr:FUSC family protein [Legionella sainthelensi]KTD60554.1 inner membrane protein [Legionella sainthelensi]VEH31102.1 inner membrane protein [Legionella sainthelensi]